MERILTIEENAFFVDYKNCADGPVICGIRCLNDVILYSGGKAVPFDKGDSVPLDYAQSAFMHLRDRAPLASNLRDEVLKVSTKYLVPASEK